MPIEKMEMWDKTYQGWISQKEMIFLIQEINNPEFGNKLPMILFILSCAYIKFYPN